MTMPHSDAKYVQLFKGQNFECLAQGLKNIFEHIGYAPSVIRFDNMSTAVKTIKAQGEREVTDNFRRLQCHYGFQSNFCNPEAGNEKGSVENYVGYSRRNYFVPVPQIDNLEEYNRNLLKQCDNDLVREHYKHEQHALYCSICIKSINSAYYTKLKDSTKTILCYKKGAVFLEIAP